MTQTCIKPQSGYNSTTYIPAYVDGQRCLGLRITYNLTIPHTHHTWVYNRPSNIPYSQGQIVKDILIGNDYVRFFPHTTEAYPYFKYDTRRELYFIDFKPFSYTFTQVYRESDLEQFPEVFDRTIQDSKKKGFNFNQYASYYMRDFLLGATKAHLKFLEKRGWGLVDYKTTPVTYS